MLRAVLLVASVALVSPAAASAQEQADIDRARQLFEEADVRIEQGRLAEARELLDESLSLVPRVSTAFNLAVVLRAMGETLEAESTLDALLDGEHGELPAERRPRVEALRDEVRAEIAVLAIVVAGSDGVAVRVDGRQVATIDEGVAHRARVDAGRHTVVVAAPDGRTLDESVEVERGQELDLLLRMPAARGGLGEDEAEDGGVLASPWFWIVTGVVVAAGATTAILLLTDDRTADPVTDPVFPVGMVLRSGR